MLGSKEQISPLKFSNKKGASMLQIKNIQNENLQDKNLNKKLTYESTCNSKQEKLLNERKETNTKYTGILSILSQKMFNLYQKL